MKFHAPEQENDRVFNNADSFAIAFDKAWKDNQAEIAGTGEETISRVEFVLSKLSHHPFLQNSPDLARKIAQFRLRLLNIE